MWGGIPVGHNMPASLRPGPGPGGGAAGPRALRQIKPEGIFWHTYQEPSPRALEPPQLETFLSAESA